MTKPYRDCRAYSRRYPDNNRTPSHQGYTDGHPDTGRSQPPDPVPSATPVPIPDGCCPSASSSHSYTRHSRKPSPHQPEAGRASYGTMSAPSYCHRRPHWRLPPVAADAPSPQGSHSYSAAPVLSGSQPPPYCPATDNRYATTSAHGCCQVPPSVLGDRCSVPSWPDRSSSVTLRTSPDSSGR